MAKKIEKDVHSRQMLGFDVDGDLLEVSDVQIFTPVQKRKYKKGAFIMQSFEFDNLIIEKNYSGLTFKVLSALKLRYGFNNEIKHFTQQELAKQLKTTQPNISREIKRLLDDKIIIKRENTFFFNEIYFSGSGDKK